MIFGQIAKLLVIFWFKYYWGWCRETEMSWGRWMELGGGWNELGGGGWSWMEVDRTGWRWVHSLVLPFLLLFLFIWQKKWIIKLGKSLTHCSKRRAYLSYYSPDPLKSQLFRSYKFDILVSSLKKQYTQQKFALMKTSWRLYNDVFRLYLQKTSSRLFKTAWSRRIYSP